MGTVYEASRRGRYAMWNYLTIPFLLTYSGVQTRQINPWREDGQTWRRLHVTFPPAIATHHPEQLFYFGDDGLLRRRAAAGLQAACAIAAGLLVVVAQLNLTTR